MNENKTGGAFRAVLIVGIILAAFVGSYSLAAGRSRAAAPLLGGAPSAAGAAKQVAAGASSGSAGGAACACCGGSSAPSEPIEGSAAVEGDIQRISVDVSKGYYDPNVIRLTAGVPAEITFSQSSGCTAQVMSEELGFFEDLTSGPKTISLPALQPGEYSFSCGMAMVFGTIVVE